MVLLLLSDGLDGFLLKIELKLGETHGKPPLNNQATELMLEAYVRIHPAGSLINSAICEDISKFCLQF